MKKALSILLALALAACMAVPAFAADALTARREQKQSVAFTVPQPDYTVTLSNTLDAIPYRNTSFNKVATVTITAGESLDTENYGIGWITMGTNEAGTGTSYGAACFIPQDGPHKGDYAYRIHSDLSYQAGGTKPQQLYEIAGSKYDGLAKFNPERSFSYDVYLRILEDDWNRADAGAYQTTLYHRTQAALKTDIKSLTK